MGLGELGTGKHFSRFLTGGGVDVEILEEDFRVACGRCSVLCLVCGLDVVGIGGDGRGCVECRYLAVSPGDAIALRLGCLNDEFEVRRVRQGCSLE